MVLICRLPPALNSLYSAGESLPMKKSLLGIAIAAKVKYGFTAVSIMYIADLLAPGPSGPPMVPRTAPGSAAPKAACQAPPTPPSATETITAPATPPRLKASKLPVLKPRCCGANEMLLVGARFSIVTVTWTGTGTDWAAVAAANRAAAVVRRAKRGVLMNGMGGLLAVGCSGPDRSSPLHRCEKLRLTESSPPCHGAVNFGWPWWSRW